MNKLNSWNRLHSNLTSLILWWALSTTVIVPKVQSILLSQQLEKEIVILSQEIKIIKNKNRQLTLEYILWTPLPREDINLTPYKIKKTVPITNHFFKEQSTIYKI